MIDDEILCSLELLKNSRFLMLSGVFLVCVFSQEIPWKFVEMVLQNYYATNRDH